jgi:hypothetical protein
MKKKLLFLIVFISLNLYPKNNSSVSIPLSSACAITNSYCYGSNSGSLHIVAIGGQSPYTYSINNGPFQSIIFDTFNLSPGTYTIITKDALGATVFNSVVITEPAILNGTVIVSGRNLTVNATGGTAPYAYWLTINGSLAANAQTSSTFSNLAPGTYTVSVKDSNGCLVIIEDAIIKPPLIATITITKEVDCVSNNASIMVTAIGGQAPYTYSLNDGPYQPNNIFDNLNPGSYSITVKDAVNTVSNPNAIVINPFVPVSGAAIFSKPIDCDGKSTITITSNGGKMPHDYSIDGGINYTADNTFYNVPAGNYVCFVRDQNHCISPAILIAVEYYPTLKATASSGTLLCAKDKTSLTVTATGGKSPYQYSLNNNPYSTNDTYTNVGFGSYGLTIKDANDCLIKVSHTVIEPEPILADFIINEQTLTINAEGGSAPYQFSVDSTAYQSDNVFNNLSFGNHKILIKDSKGCESNTFSASIKASPLTNLITLTKKLDCNSNAEINIAASGGIAPYSYSLNGNPYQSSNIFSNLSAGIYSVTVKDATNTISTTNTITVNPVIPITAITTITKPIDCVSNATITVTATGGTGSYTYSKDGGITFIASNIFTNLTAGTYRFTVRDSSNCTVLTNDIILTQPTLLTVTATKTNITCSGSSDGMIYINTTGGQAPYEYSIGNGYQTSNVFTGLSAGSYNITTKDALGCSSMMSIDIVQPTMLNTTTIITKPIDCLSNASLNVNATGGVAPYKYSIDGGKTFVSNPIFENLTAGTYSISSKDSNGCLTSNYHIMIDSPTALTGAATITNISCNGSNDGTVAVSTIGGQAPYSYSIGNGYQTSNVFTGLSAGSYNVTTKDALGCFVMMSVDIVQPTLLNTTAIITKPIDCLSNASFNVTATGGTPPYLYSIDNGITFVSTPVFSISTAGSYSVYVKDSNGCISQNYITIAPTSPLIVTTTNSNINCYGDTGSITAIVTGGQAPYSYSIGNGFQTSNVFTNLSAGIYNLTIKDTLGCLVTTTATISEPAAPLTAILETKDQTITIIAIGGTGSMKYAISPDLNVFTATNTFTNLSPGIYEIAVKDENGCILTYNATINAPAPLVNGKSETTIIFKIGQTLADIKLDIQNIKWYLKAIGITSKTSRTTETPLPLNTIIVDGTTYYASQTVNGVESTERLAVTVKSNGSLATKNFDLANVNYSPNPVKHILTINNTTAIDEIEIFSVSGKSVLSKKINSTHSEIDLSGFSTGVYFLKVKSEGKEKTIKIIKE